MINDVVKRDSIILFPKTARLRLAIELNDVLYRGVFGVSHIRDDVTQGLDHA